jgi:Ras-related protein Rab-5C
VYDIASKDSFERAEKWIAEVKEKSEPNVALILVGNKCDLPPESRVIKKEDAALYATNAGLKFIESSAKTGENIDNIFYQLLESIPSINNPHLGVHLTQKPQNQKKHCCGN